MFGLPVQPWELANARSEWGNVLLNLPAEHRRPVAARTASSGRTRTYEVVGEVLCFIEPGFPQEPQDRPQGAGQKTEMYWNLILPVGTGVQRDDQFIINHQAYEVVDTDASGDENLTLDVVQTVRCQRLKGLVATILRAQVIAAGAAVRPATLVVV